MDGEGGGARRVHGEVLELVKRAEERVRAVLASLDLVEGARRTGRIELAKIRGDIFADFLVLFSLTRRSNSSLVDDSAEQEKLERRAGGKRSKTMSKPIQKTPLHLFTCSVPTTASSTASPPPHTSSPASHT